jgi:hypothetical protein
MDILMSAPNRPTGLSLLTLGEASRLLEAQVTKKIEHEKGNFPLKLQVLSPRPFRKRRLKRINLDDARNVTGILFLEHTSIVWLFPAIDIPELDTSLIGWDGDLCLLQAF